MASADGARTSAYGLDRIGDRINRVCHTGNARLGGYYPEMNLLIPLWYHDRQSQTPASKGVPVRIVA